MLGSQNYSTLLNADTLDMSVVFLLRYSFVLKLFHMWNTKVNTKQIKVSEYCTVLLLVAGTGVGGCSVKTSHTPDRNRNTSRTCKKWSSTSPGIYDNNF